MVTERMRQVIEEVTNLPPDEQDRVAAAIQTLLRQPALSSDEARPEVMDAFDDVMAESTAILEYLRDK
jgi:hypothetical protein